MKIVTCVAKSKKIIIKYSVGMHNMFKYMHIINDK